MSIAGVIGRKRIKISMNYQPEANQPLAGKYATNLQIKFLI